jgi:hypothetical protein
MGHKSIMITNFWEQIRQQIRSCIDREGCENFTSWFPVRYTMFVEESDGVRSKFAEISADPKFSLWKKILEEEPTFKAQRLPYAPYTTADAIHHFYHIFKFLKTTNYDFTQSKSIIEFGGGYGVVARLIRSIGFAGEYIIYDLPEMLELQKYYLGLHNFPAKLTNDLNELPNEADLLVGLWSLSEAPISLRDHILYNRNFNGYLMAYQNKFEGIDNFEHCLNKITTKHAYSNKMNWHLESIDDTNSYLFGIKK